MTLRVTLMLAWFDEPEEMLYKAVRSSEVIANRIFAADGAYELVGDKAPESPPSQKEAIQQAAEDAGIQVTFLEPRLWKGQVEKRNALLDAATSDRQERDWVMPLDADWVLHGIREEIQMELNSHRIEQFKVKFRQPKNPNRTNRDFPHAWHANYDGKTRLEPLLFRAMSDMRLENTHWHYSGVRKNGVRVGFSGGARIYPPAVSRDMQATFLIEHRCMFRDDKTLLRNRDFCLKRDKLKRQNGYED